MNGQKSQSEEKEFDSQEGEGIFPVATYEPSDSSEEYLDQVNKIMEGEVDF